jgi:hypothetical protein
MTKKPVFVWCASIVAIGGMLWLGGQPFSAAQEPGAMVQPIPAMQPAMQPMTQPMMQPTMQPTMQPLPATQPLAPPMTAAPPQTPPEAPPQYSPQTSPVLLPPPPGLVNGAPPQTPPGPQNPAVVGDDSAEFCGAILCSPPGQFWLRADYLAWWTNGTRLPALVTNAPQFESPDLSNPNTTVVFGNQTVGNDMRSGVRATLGAWLDRCHVWSLEADYLSLGERTNGFTQTSSGDPVSIGRPIFDVLNAGPGAQLVASTDLVQGTVNVEVSSYLQSSGVLLGRNLCSCNSCDECDLSGGPQEQACDSPLSFGSRTDLLVGFRYYKLTDRVTVGENLLITDPLSSDLGSTFAVQDNFYTQNQFFGSEIGLRTQLYRGRWSVDIMTKVAMGNNHQTVKINGTTEYTPLGSIPQPSSTGVLATNSNSIIFSRDALAVIPQLSLQLGYQLDCHWKAYIGYDILYWGAVARAADQIDSNVNPNNWQPNLQTTTLSPGAGTGLPFPQIRSATSAFWAQGVNVGTEFRF